MIPIVRAFGQVNRPAATHLPAVSLGGKRWYKTVQVSSTYVSYPKPDTTESEDNVRSDLLETNMSPEELMREATFIMNVVETEAAKTESEQSVRSDPLSE